MSVKQQLTEAFQKDLRSRIAKANEKLGYLYPRYDELRRELENLDHEIMEINREKWSCERKLTPIFKCKPQTGIMPPSQNNKKLPNIKELTDEQVEELFNTLKGV